MKCPNCYNYGKGVEMDRSKSMIVWICPKCKTWYDDEYFLTESYIGSKQRKNGIEDE